VYLVLDTPAICRHLSLLRTLVKSGNFVVIIPIQGMSQHISNFAISFVLVSKIRYYPVGKIGKTGFILIKDFWGPYFLFNVYSTNLLWLKS